MIQNFINLEFFQCFSYFKDCNWTTVFVSFPPNVSNPHNSIIITIGLMCVGWCRSEMLLSKGVGEDWYSYLNACLYGKLLIGLLFNSFQLGKLKLMCVSRLYIMHFICTQLIQMCAWLWVVHCITNVDYGKCKVYNRELGFLFYLRSFHCMKIRASWRS